MQNPMKRVLCLVMTVIIVLSMMPAVFAADTAAAALAINANTGAQYDNLTDALLEAAEGQTVRLQQDVQDIMTMVLEGVTLDLNGYTLTTNYMTAFGDLVDSSADNAGLLQVADSRFMLQQSNSQLPVKTAEGYRFAQLGGFNTAMPTASKYVFQPLFEAAAHEALAQGREATGVSVEVFVTWKQGDGTRAQRFVFNDSHLTGFLGSYKPATGKYSKQFALTLMGAEDFEELTFSARIVSQTGVVFDANSDVSQPESDFTVDEDNKLVGDMTLESAHGEALVADGTQLEKGAKSLQLKTTAMDATGSDVEVDDSQELTSLDVHVDGIAKENTVPVIVTLNELAPEFLNKGNISLFHVENGETVEMTRVYSLEELDAHNEFYYDIVTGTVKVAIASFSEIVIRSTKANAWNGHQDTSWYNTTDKEFTIYNADQLAGFGAIVDGKANGIAYDTFDGKVIKLGFDIDLYGKYTEEERGTKEEFRSFDPIGYTYETSAGGRVFKGEFDGQGHAIRNLFQHGWDMGYTYGTQGGGLFASVVDASFHDLVIDNAKVVMECVDMGALVGYAYGTCKFENIIVKNSVIANYNRYTGGVVGEVNGDHTFINVDVDADTTISALWGTFDPSCGGIIGGKWGDAKVYMERCDVACKLDVYNDVTSAYRWYSYRRCGMLIGYTEESKTINGRTEATASFLTTKDCTVQYGDWAEYTYCEFEHTYPFVRVQEGLYNSAYSNPRYGHPVDVNGNTVVDGNHAHRTGEAHDIEIFFNQLYGGGQGCYGGNGHLGEGSVEIVNNLEPAKKFQAKQEYVVVKAGQEYTLGELFTATGNGEPIQQFYLISYISPANIEDVGQISGTYDRYDTDWTQSKVTFSGMGEAKLTLNDYYYCEPTVLTVYIQPEFTVTVQQQFNNVPAGKDLYAIYLSAAKPVMVSDYSYTVNGEQVSVQYNAMMDSHPIYIGSLTVDAGASVDGIVQNVAVNTLFDITVPGFVNPVQKGYIYHDNAHNGWTAWSSATTLPNTSGKYYLTKDVTLSTQTSFDNQDIILCLNGKTITNTCTNTTAHRDRAYSVGNNGILSICDCCATVKDGQYNAGLITGMSQGAIIIPSTQDQTKRNAAIYLYDGIISGNELIENCAAVLVQSGSKFHMAGGMITGNTNVGKQVDGIWTKDYGSGIYLSSSEFYFYNGVISNNTSTRGGGIWAVDGSTLNIYNGLITGNRAYHNTRNSGEVNAGLAYDKGWGGGIYLSRCELNMYGGEISHNTAASNGGGIFAVKSTMNLVGGLIEYNEAKGVLENVTQGTTQTPENTEPTIDPSTPSTVDGEVSGDDGGHTGSGGGDIGGEETTTTRIKTGTGYGGGIYVTQTQANIEGISINNNTASHAGAIFITGATSNVQLRDVTMMGNACHSTGAMALYAEAGSNVTITDGLITENKGLGTYGTSSAAIYLPNAATKLTLVGAPVITDNCRVTQNNLERNIYLQNSIYEDQLDKYPHAKLTLGVLTEGAKFTVTTQMSVNADEEYCQNVDNWLVYEQGTVDNWSSRYMTYTQYATRPIVVEDNKLVLAADGHRNPSHNEDGSNWQPYGGSAIECNTLPSQSGHYYLTQDIVMTENRTYWDQNAGIDRDVGVLLDGDQQIVICLNGHDITAFSRLYRISRNASVTICDCCAEADRGTIYSGGNFATVYEDTAIGERSFGINGGVICAVSGANGAKIALKNVNISGKNGETQRAASYGGAICLATTGVTATIENVTMKDLQAGAIINNASGKPIHYGGGAIYATSDVTVTITDAVFDNCDTVECSGGALHLVADAGATITNTQFINCDSKANGGAIASTGSKGLTITGCTFTGCTATADGSAIFFDKEESAVTISGTTFTECAAGGNGTIKVNCSNTTLTINGNSKFENCTSAKSGGAIYLASTVAATIEETEFIGCVTQQNGGAICNASKAQVGITNCKFSQCTATDKGGAMIIDAGEATVNISGATFKGCQANGNGGAVYVTGAGQVNITSTTMDGSNVKGNNAVWGGALFCRSKVLNITSSTIKNHVAVQYGAIQLNNGCVATFNAVTVTGNSSTNAIGAINVEGSAKLTLIDCSITGNTSGSYGAVYVFNKESSLMIKGSTKISGNTLKSGASSNLYLLTKKSTTSSMAAIVRLVELTQGAEIYFNVGFDVKDYHEYDQATRIVAACDSGNYTNYLFSDVVNAANEQPRYAADTIVSGYSYTYTIYNPYK